MEFVIVYFDCFMRGFLRRRDEYFNFNVIARSVYSSLLFFGLTLCSITLDDKLCHRTLRVFSFKSLALGKLLKVHNSRLFYYFCRLLVRERKMLLYVDTQLDNDSVLENLGLRSSLYKSKSKINLTNR